MVLCHGRIVVVQGFMRWMSSSQGRKHIDPSKVRNIGIVAHVDAGKTTLTDRMLYYSKAVASLGNVDHGNTVTDYLQIERERGITINTAVIDLDWRGHCIRIFDTPGHVDFSFEVSRSFSALDGAIVVIDASAGVQSQTLNVFKLIKEFRIPTLFFINKIDKRNARFYDSVDSIRNSFDRAPLVVHSPFPDENSSIFDVVKKQRVFWDLEKDSTGSEYSEIDCSITTSQQTALSDILIGYCADVSDEVAELVLSGDYVEHELCNRIISEKCCDLSISPVICGSALRNIGVQLLLDSIVEYLPSPLDKHWLNKWNSDEFIAKCFKSVPLNNQKTVAFLRIFSGRLDVGRGVNLIRNNTDVVTVGKLLDVKADRFTPYHGVAALGDVVGVSRSDFAIKTGDILTRSKLANFDELCSYIPVPKASDLAPVCFYRIEVSSPTQLDKLITTLDLMTHLDLSLSYQLVGADQVILGGQGELHLEMAKHFIENEYKLGDVWFGPIEVEYQEVISGECAEDMTYEFTATSGSRRSAKISACMKPAGENKIDFEADCLSQDYVQIWRNAFESFLRSGHTKANIHFTIRSFSCSTGNASIQSAICSYFLGKYLANCQPQLHEPVSRVSIVMPQAYRTVVSDELLSRGAVLDHENSSFGFSAEEEACIEADIPLKATFGLSSLIRKVSSGYANINLSVNAYQPVGL